MTPFHRIISKKKLNWRITKSNLVALRVKSGIKMKLNFSYLLALGVVLALSAISATPAIAQEEGIPGYELQDPVHPGLNSEDKVLLLDSEIRSARRDSVVSTKIYSPKKTMAPVRLNKTKNEADPLSFNFLYYIIETFKSSDILDRKD
jgi:hypothetical protein